jgi:hypothetical protein
MDWSRRPSSQESDCPTEYSTTSEQPTFSRWTSTLNSRQPTNKKKDLTQMRSKLEEKGSNKTLKNKFNFCLIKEKSFFKLLEMTLCE